MLHAHYDCDTILSANVLFTSSLNAFLSRIQKCNIYNNTTINDEGQLLSNETHVTTVLCTIINSVFSKIPFVDIQISVRVDDNDHNDESSNNNSNKKDSKFESNHFFTINNFDRTTILDSNSSMDLNNIHRTLCDVVSNMHINCINNNNIEQNNNTNNIIQIIDNDESNNNTSKNNNNYNVSTMLSQTAINALHNILQSVLVDELRMMIITTTTTASCTTTGTSVEQQQQQQQNESSGANRITTELEQYITSICYIIGTIWIVYDCLTIQSFSCSTIPIHNLTVVRNLSHHFITVPINIIMKSDEENNNNNHKDFYLNIDGLVLVRQLLEYSSMKNSCNNNNNNNNNNISGPPCPFQLIQPISIGSVSINYDNTSQRHSIYLLLGNVNDSTTGSSNSVRNKNETLLRLQDDYKEQQSSLLQNLQKSSSEESLLKDVIWTEMIQIEANIDDMTSEHLAYACDVLLNDGKAADVWTTSICMKKGRSAHTLHCLCTLSTRDSILVLLFQNTTTLGIRIQPINRVSLHRTIVSIPIISCCPQYEEICTRMSTGTVDVVVDDDKQQQQQQQKLCNIDVKIGYLNGTITSIKAEFDHCQIVAKVTGIPINTIASAAVDVALKQVK